MPTTTDNKQDPPLTAEDSKELKALARDLKRVEKERERLLNKRRKTVHRLYRRKDVPISEMATIFGISRQALVKDINVLDKAADARKATKAASTNGSAAPAKGRKVRRKATS